VDVFVQEQEEVPSEQNCSHEYGNNTNSNSTAFNWEASTAGRVLSEIVGAYAITAAAWCLDWRSEWIIIIFFLVLLFLIFFLLVLLFLLRFLAGLVGTLGFLLFSSGFILLLLAFGGSAF